MEGHWALWLAGGLVSVAAGSAFGALEAVLWRTPRQRMDQWPRSPRLQMLAADFAHPRDCLFTFLILAGALCRGAGWWALWVAAAGLSAAAALPIWVCVSSLLVPAVVLGVLPAMFTARRPRAWERPLLRAGGAVLRLAGPFFDRLHPLVASAGRRLFPWSAAARARLGPEEAETLVRVREEEGAFGFEEGEVLTEVLRLSRATVRHYMTPRVDVVFVEDSMTNDEVRALLRKRHFVRAPVIADTPDEVIGLLDTRLLVRMPDEMHFTEALLPPSFVPETMEASTLLSGFLKHRQPLAVVLDEFGGVEGVVTLDDFAEEILGAAVPRAEADLYIEQLGDGRLLAAGTAHLEDLIGHLGFDPRQDGVETIGGFIVNKLGRLPRVGTSVRLGGWKVTVRAMSRKRVREVVLQRIRPDGEGGALP
jgi:CBS domain containing-hemolysin-like protein